MREIIKREMQEINGEIFEVSQIEDTFEINADEEIIRKTFRIMKTPYRDQDVEVSDNTKILIDNIKNKGTTK